MFSRIKLRTDLQFPVADANNREETASFVFCFFWFFWPVVLWGLVTLLMKDACLQIEYKWMLTYVLDLYFNFFRCELSPSVFLGLHSVLAPLHSDSAVKTQIYTAVIGLIREKTTEGSMLVWQHD